VRGDVDKALKGLGTLFLANDKPAIRKALLRLRYLDKFGEEARARRTNIERGTG
jgi:molecular chaperone HscB